MLVCAPCVLAACVVCVTGCVVVVLFLSCVMFVAFYVWIMFDDASCCVMRWLLRACCCFM